MYQVNTEVKVVKVKLTVYFTYNHFNKYIYIFNFYKKFQRTRSLALSKNKKVYNHAIDCALCTVPYNVCLSFFPGTSGAFNIVLQFKFCEFIC